MKQTVKVVLFALLFTGGFLTNAQAQIDVTVNPIGLLFSNLSASADFVLAENFSVEGQIGVGFGNDDAFGLDYFNLPITAFGKYYFNPDEDADKFYADVFLRFIARNYTADDANTTVAEYRQTRIGGGFGVGYKVVGDGGFVFDIGFGVGRAFVDNTSYESGGDRVEVDWPDIMFAGKLAIGYRFGG